MRSFLTDLMKFVAMIGIITVFCLLAVGFAPTQAKAQDQSIEQRVQEEVIKNQDRLVTNTDRSNRSEGGLVNPLNVDTLAEVMRAMCEGAPVARTIFEFGLLQSLEAFYERFGNQLDEEQKKILREGILNGYLSPGFSVSMYC